MSDKTAAVKVTESAETLDELETQQPSELALIYSLLQEQTGKIDNLPESIENCLKKLMTPKEGRNDTYLMVEKVGNLVERNYETQLSQQSLLKAMDQKLDQLIASSASQTPSSESDSSES